MTVAMELVGIYLIVIGVWAIVFLFLRADRRGNDWKNRELAVEEKQLEALAATAPVEEAEQFNDAVKKLTANVDVLSATTEAMTNGEELGDRAS